MLHLTKLLIRGGGGNVGVGIENVKRFLIELIYTNIKIIESEKSNMKTNLHVVKLNLWQDLL